MVIATRHLFDYNVKRKRIWNMVCYLFHFFISFIGVFLSQTLLSELIATPAEKLGVPGILMVLSRLQLEIIVCHFDFFDRHLN